MIVILSPAKKINFTDPAPTEHFTVPEMLEQSRQLAAVLKKYSADDLASLMGVSNRIAELNFERYQNVQPPFHLGNAKQALFSFTGDVYRHMRLSTWDNAQIDFAQQTLRILSGLYGYLRPLDLIQPYRLEMKTKLKKQEKRLFLWLLGLKLQPQVQQKFCWKNHLKIFLF